MRVALVHDWLTGMRGGERVLEELCAIFPDATIFTLIHCPGSVTRRIESMPIRTSFLNRFPGIKRHYRYCLPLYPWAIQSFDLRGFDLIISNSHAVAKGIRKPNDSIHICYCLTPMRYIWDMQSDYFHYGDSLHIRRPLLRSITLPFRAWDRLTAKHVDHFIADSLHVQKRIARCYHRSSDLIYPPVDTRFFNLPRNGKPEEFYLIVSALVPYKRLDLAVDAFNALEIPLVIVGTGPDREILQRRARNNIKFKGFVTDEELRDLYQRCRALVIPGREDFGMTSVEAQACGRPVVAYAAGGSLESVIDGETGILFRSQTVASLAQAIGLMEATEFRSEKTRANAERFSVEMYHRAIQDAVEKTQSALLRTRSTKPTLEVPIQLIPRHPSVVGVPGLAKRTLDFLLALVGLLVLGVPLLLIAMLVRLTSPGPGFFFQKRVGLAGRRFLMAKLRTMYQDAERDTGPAWAVNDDPRCTPLGGFLRRYGVDELSQLWNVLKGEMSLVGPRPERPEFHMILSETLPGFARRLEVRGGMTGLAQIRGWRGDTSLEKRLQSDLEYIDHWTIWRDLGILLQTPLMLQREKRHPRSSTPIISGS